MHRVEVFDTLFRLSSDALVAAADPFTIGAVLTGWALTHGYKLWLEEFMPRATATPGSWRFCVYVGAFLWCGVAAALWAWLWTDDYKAIPIIAILSPYLWRGAVLLPNRWLRHALTTPADRRLLHYGNSNGPKAR